MTSDDRKAFPSAPLAELCDQGRGITYGIVKVGEFARDGVPVIRGGDIRDNRIEIDQKKCVSDEVSKRFKRTILRGGEIVLNLIAEPGHSAIVPDSLAGANVSRDVAVIPVTRADTDFVNYFLQSPRCIAWLRAHLQGSVTLKINLGTLVALPVPVPPIDEQRRIAFVLRILDDKIDSNRRLAALLEETVMTLFRGRFVEFIGEDEFDESEFGALPRGWRAGTLHDIVRVHRQFVRGPSGLPYIGLDLMPRGSTVLTEWQSEAAPDGQAATYDVGDILFGKLRPYFRKVGVAPISGRCSTEILVLRAHPPQMYGVLLGHVASEAFIDHCVAVSRGTRMPRAEWSDAGSFRIAVPPVPVASSFSDLVRTFYSQIRALTVESRTLASIRNALLPRLVSGEIRVPDPADADEVIGLVAATLDTPAR